MLSTKHLIHPGPNSPSLSKEEQPEAEAPVPAGGARQAHTHFLFHVDL